MVKKNPGCTNEQAWIRNNKSDQKLHRKKTGHEIWT